MRESSSKSSSTETGRQESREWSGYWYRVVRCEQFHLLKVRGRVYTFGSGRYSQLTKINETFELLLSRLRDCSGRELILDELIDEAWRIYHDSGGDVVVKPSIPILFFGDSEKYFRSPLKVITVGLNPSRKEFPEEDRFKRFRSAEHVYPAILDGGNYLNYVAALNNYFRNDPYRGWFRWFDQVLQGFGASYYEGHRSTALHTDLCTPLATDPTWSHLGESRSQFEPAGMALWHRLVERLAPDVIVLSIARRYLDQILFTDQNAWQPFVTVQRQVETKRPYVAWTQQATLRSGATTRLLFGQAAQQPFATLNQGDLRRIGRAFLEYTDER